jgi:nicotinamidase-related amidase
VTTSRLDPGGSIVVVVDMQERLLPHIHEFPRLMAACRLMLRAAQVLELPVLMTTQYRTGLGPTHADLTELAPTVTPFDKLTFSCFGSPEFTRALAATGRTSLVLCGVESHVCVLQTGLDALAAGYRVHLVTDAASARSAANAELGHRRLERAGAVLSSTEMAIHELLVRAGTPAFKALLPHFK